MTGHQLRLDDLIDHVKSQNPAGDALVHLADAVLVSERMDELGDHLVGHFVDQARRSGASWTQIGRHIGVSKQAAQKRFVPREGGSEVGGFFERVTTRARSVVVRAAEHARDTNHARIDTDHVVLALLDDPDGLAAKAIAAQDVPDDALRAAVLSGMPAPDGPAPDKEIPFAQQTVKIFQLTLREALRLGHNYIGTEHLLLGVLADQEGRGARALAAAGVDAAETERWILATLEEIKQRPTTA